MLSTRQTSTSSRERHTEAAPGVRTEATAEAQSWIPNLRESILSQKCMNSRWRSLMPLSTRSDRTCATFSFVSITISVFSVSSKRAVSAENAPNASHTSPRPSSSCTSGTISVRIAFRSGTSSLATGSWE